MWRDLKDEEIKYLNKLVLKLENKKKFHRKIMIISYIIIVLILILSKSIKIKYLFEILEVLSINPFMWIYTYIHIQVNHTINCLSEKGYTKCIEAKVLEMFPEDSSKNTNWYANIKLIDSGEIKEKIPCYNGTNINKTLSKTGLYPEVLVIDLNSKKLLKTKDKIENNFNEDIEENIEHKYYDKSNTNNEAKFDSKTNNYLIYDLTNI